MSWKDSIQDEADFQQAATSWRDTVAAAPADVEELESALRGLAQGASFGFSDEITGGVEALLSDKTYAEARDESRAAYKRAEEANPLSYGAGQIGGAIATSFIPGLGVGSAATLAGRAGLAGASGALTGVGLSEESDLAGVAKDAAVGGVLGAGFQGLGEKVVAPLMKAGGVKLADIGGKVADKVDDWSSGALKKVGKIAANVPEEFSERYLQRSDKINDALELEDIGSYFLDDAMGQQGKVLSQLDSAAWRELNSSPSIPKASIMQKGQEFIEGILRGKDGSLTRTAGTGADLDRIGAIKQQLGEIFDAYGDNLSERDLKSIVQNLQKLGWTLEGSPKSSLQGQALQQLSGVYNDFLKTGNPSYKAAMLPVEAATKQVASLERQFVNKAAPGQMDRFLQKVKSVPRLSEESEAIRALRGLDKTTGAGVEDMIRDRLVLDSFAKADTQGSRKTIMGALAGRAAETAIGGAVGYGVGDSKEGAALGALAGFSADRYAGRVFKALLDGKIQSGEALKALAPKLGRYANVLSQAAARGNQSLAATHFVLSQTDPNYRETLKTMDDEK